MYQAQFTLRLVYQAFRPHESVMKTELFENALETGREGFVNAAVVFLVWMESIQKTELFPSFPQIQMTGARCVYEFLWRRVGV